ncbi:MAG: AAA family ATPase [Chloroflexi bacterium]|nr:AAA family ATPase [Chloroflexota bacterium]
MSTVYILLGAQGSGKTTWAKANASRLEALILASDDVRNELESTGAGDPNDGDLVFHIVEEELNWLASQGKTVIVDATHARRKWRKNHIAIARRHGARVVGLWFDAPLELCLARNAARPGGAWGDRVVPEEMVRWVWQGFEKPEVGEFDEVWKIGSIGFGRLPESMSPDNPMRSGGR